MVAVVDSAADGVGNDIEDLEIGAFIDQVGPEDSWKDALLVYPSV